MSKLCKVLVVEDEPLIRMDLAMMLEDAGCTTLEAGDAAEAIAILEANTDITVVFTDIQMPGSMDGIALAAYVRNRWPPTIIVVSSGKVKPADAVLADGVQFLSKPYEAQGLSRVITDVLGRVARM